VLEVLGGTGVVGPMAGDVRRKLVIGFWVVTREAAIFWFLNQVKKRYKRQVPASQQKSLYSRKLTWLREVEGVSPFRM
jgi:hypothetical protein